MYRSSAEHLLANGYHREAAKVFRLQARLLVQFAADSHGTEAKHDFLMQAHSVLGQACAIFNQIWYEASTLQGLDELIGVSLPVQRELVDTKLEFASLLAEMLEHCLNETKADNSKNLGKDNVIKVSFNLFSLLEDFY